MSHLILKLSLTFSVLTSLLIGLVVSISFTSERGIAEQYVLATEFKNELSYEFYLKLVDNIRHLSAPINRNSTSTYSPSWSPDGETLAYVSHGNIFLFTPRTGEEKQITFGGLSKSMPLWSPDGTKLAFTATASYPIFTLWILDLANQKRASLTWEESSAYEFSWSPDGSHLVYVAALLDDRLKVRTVEAETLRVTQLNNNPYDEWRPTWSPDGKRIYYDSAGANTNSYDLDIYAVDVTSRKTTKITSTFPSDADPLISPDSTKIMFFRGRQDQTFEIYTMNTDGSNVHRLTNSGDYYGGPFLWSDKSDRVMFSLQVANVWGLYSVKPDGTDGYFVFTYPNEPITGISLRPAKN